MLAYTSKARIDNDISTSEICSQIITSLIGKLHFYYEEQTFVFVDLQDRFWLTFTDSRHTIYQNDEHYFYAPTLKAIYVAPQSRETGLQRQILKWLTTTADEVNEHLAAFVDPFEVVSDDQTDGAWDSFLKFVEYGPQKTGDWQADVKKQRQRFIDAGFRNVKYDDAKVTDAFQQMLYVSKRCSKDDKLLIENLELS